MQLVLRKPDAYVCTVYGQWGPRGAQHMTTGAAAGRAAYLSATINQSRETSEAEMGITWSERERQIQCLSLAASNTLSFL